MNSMQSRTHCRDQDDSRGDIVRGSILQLPNGSRHAGGGIGYSRR